MVGGGGGDPLGSGRERTHPTVLTDVCTSVDLVAEKISLCLITNNIVRPVSNLMYLFINT